MSNFCDLRVAIVGECHVTGLACAMRAILPGATVNAWHVNTPSTPEQIASELPSHDVIVTQVLDLAGQGDLGITRLREIHGETKTIAFVPTLVFTGLQPDAIYTSYKGDVLPSATGVMHSAIITAAYALEVPIHEVIELFNSEVYSKLGYFDEFEDSKEKLIERYEFYGFDLIPHFQQWIEAGAFMHVPNHPRIDVLSSLATLAAADAGLVGSNCKVPSGIADYLATHEQWPVYPEIARRIGISGSYTWRCSTNSIGPEEPRERCLEHIIVQGYQRFSSCPDINLLTPRVKSVCNRLQEFLGKRRKLFEQVDRTSNSAGDGRT